MRTPLASAPAVLLVVLIALLAASATPATAQDTQPGWTVDPSTVDYGTVSAAADAQTRTVRVTPPDGVEGAALSVARVFSPAVSAIVTPPAEGERTWRVDVTLNPKKATAMGAFSSKLYLSTGVESTPIVSVLVSATIEATRLRLLAYYIGETGRAVLDRLQASIDKIVEAQQAEYSAKPQDDDAAFAELFALKQRYGFIRDDASQTVELIVVKPDGTAVHLVGEAEITQGLAELEAGGGTDPGVGSASSGNNAGGEGQFQKIPVRVYVAADIDIDHARDAVRRFNEAVGGVAELQVYDLTPEVIGQLGIDPQLPEGQSVKCLALVQLPGNDQQAHWAVSENGDAIIQIARKIVLHFNPTAFDNEASGDNTGTTPAANAGGNVPTGNTSSAASALANAADGEGGKDNTITWDAFLLVVLIMMVLLVGFTLLFVNLSVERALTKAGITTAAAPAATAATPTKEKEEATTKSTDDE